MTVIARPHASLSMQTNCNQVHPSISASLAGVSSKFFQTLENTTSDPVSQTDFHGLIKSELTPLEIGVLELGGASLTPSNQRDDSEAENPLRAIADAIWLATWFQNNAPAPAPAPALEQAPATKTEIVDSNSFSPSQVSAQFTTTATASSSCPPPVTVSGDHLKSTEDFFKAPLDINESVKLGQFLGFRDLKVLGNDSRMIVIKEAVQVSLNHHGGQKFIQQTLGSEAVEKSPQSAAHSTLNLADTFKQWVEQSSLSLVLVQSNVPPNVSSPFPLPVTVSGRVEAALMEAPSKPLATFSSDLSSRIAVPISENQKQNPWLSPEQPLNSIANASTPSPSGATASVALPSAIAFLATLQTASKDSVNWDKQTPKKLSTDSDNLRSTEVLFKAPMDIGGSVKLGQSVGFKDIQDAGNDRVMPVIPGPAQVNLDPHIGQNLTDQTVVTEAVAQSHIPDAQSTPNMVDTVHQWVERSLQLVELKVPEAGQDSLQVRIELNGQEATIYFLTDHEQYRDAIESQIENLSDRLADQGLKLAGSFVGQGSTQNSPHKPSAHNILSRRHESQLDSVKVLSIDPVLREIKSGHHGLVLDVFA